jgi:hypothetical protein
MNPTDKIKTQGIDAKKDSAPKVSVFDIYIPIDGPLAHPRADDPLDETLVLDIMEQGGVIEPVDVRRDGMHGDKLRLTLIDGSRRCLHLREAIKRWEEAGAFKDALRYIPIRYFVGDDKAALLHRLKKNTDPLKKPDAPSVLAKTAMQLERAKATPDEILAVMPRSVSSKSELAALLRWPDLTEEAAALFDAGTVALGVLGAVFDVPREKQAAIAQELAEAGMTTMKGATRLLNRKRTQETPARNENKPVTAKDTMIASASTDWTPPASDAKTEEKAMLDTARPTGQKMHPKTIEQIAHAVERSEDTVEIAIKTANEECFGEGVEAPEGVLEALATSARAEGFVIACRLMLGKIALASLPESLRKTIIEAQGKKGS